jgi:DNA-binding SARP family transcriptional activator
MTFADRHSGRGRAGRVLGGAGAAAVLAGMLAGIPWAGWHYIGWPLPDHLPTWDETLEVLSRPAGAGLILNILTCAGWLLWAAFLLDVTRCAAAAARTARRPTLAPLTVDWRAGPVHALAATLVSALVLTLLGARAAPASASTPTTAPEVPPATAAGAADHAPVTAAAAPRRQAPVVFVRPPAGGIHDSLWRIAQRNLGDGRRWPEIYRANAGRLQPDGRRLASPTLILPGWHLTIPTTAPPADPAPPGRPGAPGGHHAPPAPPPRPPTPAATGTAPTTPAPAPAVPPDAGPGDGTSARPAPGIELPGGGYLGLGAVTLIAAAAVAASRRRIRARTDAHDDGGGHEWEDNDMAPVIRAIRLSHDSHHPDTAPPPPDNRPASGPDRPLAAAAAADPSARPSAPASGAAESAGRVAVRGERHGEAVVLDLAHTRGIGLIGQGAPDAARALLVTLLAGAHQPGAAPVEIIASADALAAVLPDTAGRLPRQLRLTADLDTALDAAEIELVTRARLAAGRRTELGTLVLLARPHAHAARRLQAVLDNGSTLGIAAVLLGQWRPGGTLRVRPDGTIAAASPDLADTLDRARLFTLPTANAAVLLDLLATQPEGDDDLSAGPGPDSAAGADTRATAAGLYEAQADSAGSDAGVRVDEAAAGDARPAAGDPLVGDTTDRPSTQTSGDRLPVPARLSAAGHGTPSGSHGSSDGSGQPSTSRAAAAPPRPLGPTDQADQTALADALRPGPAPADRAPGRPVGGSGRAGHLAAGDAERGGVPLRLTVLGVLHLRHRSSRDVEDSELIGALAPRQRELLVYLALHPDGARREAVAAAMWPDAPTDRPFNSFHATLSQLRKALAGATGGAVRDLTVLADGRYRLDPAVVEADLWQLRRLLSAATRARGADRLALLQQVPDLYPGDLADDLDAEWATGPREALRRDVLDALSTLTRTAARAGTDQRQILAWLEHARTLDPYNEQIYRDIIRTQASLGHHDSADRTLALLTTTLAEIDQEPTPDIRRLANQLHKPPASATA